MSTLEYSFKNKNIKYITNFLLELKDIFILDLSNNRIKYIPEKITNLKNLISLDLNNNNIFIFSIWLCQL